MKFLIVLLATITVAAAGTIQLHDGTSRSPSSVLYDAIERFRDQMPCGFEKLNIPPLAPLKIKHKEFTFATASMSVYGEVNKVRVDGLNEFDIKQVNVNVFREKIDLNLFWKNIFVQGLYDLEVISNNYGLTVDSKGSGDMFLDIKNVNVEGTITYSLNFFTNQIKVNEIKIVVTVGGVNSNIGGQGFDNPKLNEIIDEIILWTFNENQEIVTATIEEALLPAVSNAVEGMNLNDLVAAIGGGDGETTVCIPPENA